MNNKFKIMLSLILALTLVMGGVASAATMVFYDVTTSTSYNDDMTEAEIDELVQAYINGNEIAKVVGGKLVNYNAYKAAVAAVILANAGKTNAEIAAAIDAAMPGILAGLDEVVIQDNWEIKLSTNAMNNTIVADGDDNTTITIEIVDKNNNDAVVPVNGIVIEMFTSHGSLASTGDENRVTLQNGVGTIKLNSEMSATPLVVEVTAKLYEGSQAQKYPIGKKEVILNVWFQPIGEEDLVAPAVLIAAESNQADRVTLFFDKEVNVEDYECALNTFGPGNKGTIFGVDQPVGFWNIIGYLPVQGNPNALVAILDLSDGPLTDNTWTEVTSMTWSDYGWSENWVTFLLTDARQPELTNIAVVEDSMNELRLEFSESIYNINRITIDGMYDAFYEIDTFEPAKWVDILGRSYNIIEGRPYNCTDKDVTFVPAIDNRHFADVTFTGGWLTAGTHAVTVTGVKDWAGVTDPRNVSTTQTLEFNVLDNTLIPTVEVVVESPEQIRMTFPKYVDFEDEEYGENWWLEYKRDGNWVKVEEGKISTFNNTPEGKQVVLETTWDWTQHFNTKDAPFVNYYNFEMRLHADAGLLLNTKNGKLNEELKLLLNKRGNALPRTPLDFEDVISPKLVEVKQIGDYSFNIAMNEPVKYDGFEDTPSQQQVTTPEVTVEFIGTKGGVVQTINGKVIGYGDKYSKDMVITVGEALISLQNLVDKEGYSEDWTLNVKNITDDVGNSAETVVYEFKVEKTGPVKPVEEDFWISETYFIDNGDGLVRLYVQYTDLIRHVGGPESAILLSNYSINNQKLPASVQVVVDENSKTTLGEFTGYTRVIIEIPESFFDEYGHQDESTFTLEVVKTLLAIDGDEFKGFLPWPAFTRYQEVVGSFWNSEILGAAEDAVEEAVLSEDQDDVDAAQVLVDGLPESDEKYNLQGRLNAVQFDLNLAAAEVAVAEAEAEANKLDADVVAAQLLINKLPAGPQKAALQARLDLVEAEAAVEVAEGSETQADIDAAQVLVDALPDSDEKDVLQARLDAVKDAIDLVAAIANVKALIAALPAAADVDISHGPQINEAALAFDDLGPTVQNDNLTAGEVAKMNAVWNMFLDVEAVYNAKAALAFTVRGISGPHHIAPDFEGPVAIGPNGLTYAITNTTANISGSVNGEGKINAKMTRTAGHYLGNITVTISRGTVTDTKIFDVEVPGTITNDGSGNYGHVTVEAQ